MDGTSTIDLQAIADQLKISLRSVQQTVALLDDGNTVPFITRYRKEATGGLDEEQIRDVASAVESARQIADRRDAIIRLLGEQENLTAELTAALNAASTLTELEDIYLPFRPRRHTRAEAARERGLGPIAEEIWNGELDARETEPRLNALVGADNELPDREAVENGIQDIIAEKISEQIDLRNRCRRIARRTGLLVSAATKTAAEQGQEFRDYFDFSESLSKIKPHRILAINRGEQKKMLRVRVDWDEARANTELCISLRTSSHPQSGIMEAAVADSLHRLLGPGITREIRKEQTDDAETHAVTVFATNLRNRLMQPPMTGTPVLAIDPGYRTGCKVAVLDAQGELVTHTVVHVTTAAATTAAGETLTELLTTHGVTRVAIGNGTASRETEELVAGVIKNSLPEVSYIVVDEAGASIYSASPVAREEFPELDATVRGTISIGRRLQDPLSELVKIDPEHIGVGMYQHDIDSRKLKASLDEVVESCVNRVGVDVNTASAPLLRHVAGLSQLTASRIVGHRSDKGPFRSRKELLSVAGVGPATFTQAAGFLRITGGEEPLDGTSIHPESYDAALKLLGDLEIDVDSLMTSDDESQAAREKLAALSPTETAKQLGIGTPTVIDILADLQKPGRDPRTELPEPVFRSGVLSADDLTPGMQVSGTVQNVVDFGAFVDIGVKESGLIHISRMAAGYVESPHERVAVGDIVNVWIESIDRNRGRIGLSLVPPE